MILQEGYRAPDFRIATVGGVSRALHDYRGAPILVYGWASWDASKDSLPALQKLHEKIRVVSIAFEARGPEPAMACLKPAGASFELLLDATCVLSRMWGVKKIPFVVLLDEEGYVRQVAQSLDDVALDKQVERKGELKADRGDTRVDVLVQGCPIYLSRGRTADAAGSLREALKLDPKNEIIRRQIEVVEAK